MRGKRASPVLRGAGRSNAPGLPGDVKACVRSPGARANQRHTEVRTFATTTNALLELRDWLVGQGVTLIAMEATGDYWRPPFYLLEDDLNIILVNPAHTKGLPGRKSDVTDSMWLAQLAECGLLRASFVPPTPIRELRDLTRYRTTLSREHTREAARLEKELEDFRDQDLLRCHRHPGRVRPGDARGADRRGTRPAGPGPDGQGPDAHQDHPTDPGTGRPVRAAPRVPVPDAPGPPRRPGGGHRQALHPNRGRPGTLS